MLSVILSFLGGPPPLPTGAIPGQPQVPTPSANPPAPTLPPSNLVDTVSGYEGVTFQAGIEPMPCLRF